MTISLNDIVEWGNPLNPKRGRLREIRENMPARKSGQRLGTWTNKFYKTRALVEIFHRNGSSGLAWITLTKLRKV